MDLDFSDDFCLFDNPIAISYRVKSTESSWAEGVDVDYCQRNLVSKKDLEKNASIVNEVSSVFHLWTSRLGDIVPKKGDLIVQESTQWRVESVEEMDRDCNGPQRYRCVVVRTKKVIP